MRRSARCGVVMAAVWLVASSSLPARAADDKATKEAEARFNEGLARVKVKDYEAARLSFEQAYAVLHRPLILWNLALAEEKTGHLVDAIAHFRRVVRDAANEADQANAQKHVDALTSQLGRIDVQAPPGAALRLDGGDAVATAPIADPLDVTPGHHVVEARWAPGIAKSFDVDAPAGQLAHVTFTADTAPPPAPAASAPAPAAPAASASILQPAPAAPAPDQSAPMPFWTPRTVTMATLAGAGAVALGFGIYLGLQSQSNARTAKGFANYFGDSSASACHENNASPCPQWNDAVNAQNRDAYISDALYFVAGVAAVGIAVSWFFWPKPAHNGAAWVAPAIGSGQAGLAGGGSF